MTWGWFFLIACAFYGIMKSIHKKQQWKRYRDEQEAEYRREIYHKTGKCID